MNKLIISLLVLLSFSFSNKVEAQINVNVNIGSMPAWGPVGYDYVDYYYLPDIDVYYHVAQHRFVYFERGRWIFAPALPPRCRNYDLYGGYKVVINEREPYRYHQKYHKMYAKYRGRHGQEVIRNSHDPRYFEIKEHPQHGNWKNKPGHGKGHGHGHGKHR